jgi:hypothetical protein
MRAAALDGGAAKTLVRVVEGRDWVTGSHELVVGQALAELLKLVK